jgi:hypothetical protein
MQSVQALSENTTWFLRCDRILQWQIDGLLWQSGWHAVKAMFRSAAVCCMLTFMAIQLSEAAELPMTAAAIDTARFAREACISLHISFSVDTPTVLWTHIEKQPVLFSTLWDSYGFHPPYRITQTGSALHIIDPTGMSGTLRLVGSAGETRVYIANGRLRGWGLPINIRGRVLFVLTSMTRNGATKCRLDLYGEGTGSAADIVIKAFSPVLKHYVNRRINTNIRDAETLMHDIVRIPEHVRNRLTGDLRQEFDLFIEGADIH